MNMMNRRGGRKSKKRWILIGSLMAAMMATASFAMGDMPGQLSGKTPAQPAPRNVASAAVNTVGVDVGDLDVTGGTEGKDYTYDSGMDVLNINPTDTKLTIKNKSGVTTAKTSIMFRGGATIILSGVNIATEPGHYSPIDTESNAQFDVEIIAKAGTTNIVTAPNEHCRSAIQDNCFPGDEAKKGQLNITLEDNSSLTATATAQDGSGIGAWAQDSELYNVDITVGTGATLRTQGGYAGAGIGGNSKHKGKNITITGKSATTSKVIAIGGSEGAGIGGGWDSSAEGITIDTCNVEATGGEYAAGIGGGNHSNAKTIRINNANVTAKGGTGAAGIGGGGAGIGANSEDNTSADDIQISGSSTVVKAIGGENAAGIGGGKSSTVSGATMGNGTNIKIYGGTVEAIGQLSAAGIGGGNGGSGSNITITGGTVEATGTGSGAGIGGGNGGSGSGIMISGGKVEATGGENAAGIGGGQSGSGSGIKISGDKVEANGGNYAAGIGGGRNESGSDIMISGGTVTANGGEGGAGIGGGDSKSGSNIIIIGGTVEATGGKEASWIYGGGAGIGGGYKASGSEITIIGGTVTATGEENAAGIGGGAQGSGSNITINGGTVTATGGKEAFWTYGGGAGIGGGYKESGSEITINGGAVTATGGDDAAGIGGGAEESGSNITISGGTVEATGGENAAGIGGGYKASGSKSSGNQLNGNAVVISISGINSNMDPMQGFTKTQGIAFERKTPSGSWTANMYDSVTVKADAEFPGATLQIGSDQSLTIASGVTVTVQDGATLKNEGTLTNNGSIICEGSGQVTTLLKYDVNGGEPVTPESQYYVYLNSTSGDKTYGELPTPTWDSHTFAGWYDQRTGGNQILASDKVNVNLHTVYAHWN